MCAISPGEKMTVVRSLSKLNVSFVRFWMEFLNLSNLSSFFPLLPFSSVLPCLVKLFFSKSIPLRANSILLRNLQNEAIVPCFVGHVWASPVTWKWDDYEGLFVSECTIRSVLCKPKRIRTIRGSHTTASITWPEVSLVPRWARQPAPWPRMKLMLDVFLGKKTRWRCFLSWSSVTPVLGEFEYSFLFMNIWCDDHHFM